MAQMPMGMPGAMPGTMPGGMPGAPPPGLTSPGGGLPGGDIALDELIGAPVEEKTAEQVRKDEEAYHDSAQYDLSEDERQRIVEYIIKLIDDCVAGRQEWQDIRNECLDLLHGTREEKSDPWPNCSNISVMAVPTHCKLMHSKLFPATYNENLVFWRPTEKGDVDNVELVSKFMKWVIQQDMKFQTDADDVTWNAITNGTIALKIRWDIEYRNVAKVGDDGKLEYEKVAHPRAYIDNVNIDDVYLPKLWIDEDRSAFIGQNIYSRMQDIEDLMNRNIYLDVDKTKIEAELDESVKDSIKEKRDEVQGIDTVMNAHKDSYPIRLIEICMSWMIKGEMKESVFTIGYESKTYLSGKPLEAVSPIGKRPWVIGQFIRIPGSPYGISLIEAMRGLAKELDAIHNQRIDAGSIGIAPFGFYRSASSFKPEKVVIGPGVMIPVDDIKDVNMVQLQHNPVASFQEERIIIEYIEKLTSTSAYQMGRESDIVKSRATATATMAIIGQGEQAFTILGIRLQEIISRALTKILQMYQSFMPAGYADRVLGENPGVLLFPKGLTPEEIAGQYDSYMTLDPTVANKTAERQANQAMIQMGPQLIMMAQDPRGYEMASEFLKSIGKIDVERYLGPKPKQAPQAAQGMGTFGAASAEGKGAPPVGPGMDTNMGGR